MSLIAAISPDRAARGCAWAWAVRETHWIYVDQLERVGFCQHEAGAIAHKITHGGLFTFGRTDAERWFT